jgi:ElaB/YqjD/DUF883 family membrane-anchored ribosome-binding protein
MPAPASQKTSSKIEDSLSEVSRIKSVVTDAVEEGVRSARRAIKHGRHVAEDAIEGAQRTIKRRPLQAMGVVFAAGVFAGVLAGGVATWFAFRRR